MNSNIMSSTPPERAKPCCGCCCDYRRAVIIVDIIIIVLEALVLILLPIGYFNQALMVQDEDLIKFKMIFSGVSIVTGLISIFGAYLQHLPRFAQCDLAHCRIH